MLAAGGAIDPFWAMYAQHQTAEVHKILETYRIGDLVSMCSYAQPSTASSEPTASSPAIDC